MLNVIKFKFIVFLLSSMNLIEKNYHLSDLKNKLTLNINANDINPVLSTQIIYIFLFFWNI